MNADKKFLVVVLTLLLLFAQQLSAVHPLSHLISVPLHPAHLVASDLTTPSASPQQTPHDIPEKSLCWQCPVLAALGTALVSHALTWCALLFVGRSFMAALSQPFIPRTVVPFLSRAPPR